MYFVYILYSKKHDRFYTGLTNNIERRLDEHNSRNVKATKAYEPWLVIYSELCETRSLARKREKYWKSGSGREKRIKFIS